MKAIQLKTYGPPENLLIIESPIPACAPDQVLIRNIAAGINPLDWKVRAGYLARMFPLPLPHTPGHDGAGVIVEVGHAVTHFKPHDEVFYMSDAVHPGSYAEYSAVNASLVAKKPHTVSFSMAATLPMPGQTAWTAVFDIAQTKPGMRLLIHGGAGAVGGIAVQLAKHAGAYVTTTASGPGIALAKSYGADEIIDYRSQPFQEKAKDIDVVLDTIGGPTQDASWSTLKPGGLLIAFTAPPSEDHAKAVGARTHFLNTQARGDVLAQLASRVDDGTLRLVLNRELCLEDAAAAHQLGESGASGGKMILDISTPPRFHTA